MQRFLIVPILALVLVAAGCGSSSSGGSTTSGSTPAGGGYGTKAPSTTVPSTTSAATISTTNGTLGVHLVNGQGRTLYLFQLDTGTTSACSGACAAAWPPVLTKGAPKATGAVTASKLGTSKRSNGTTQVTYGGHPLYTYALDSAAGMTNGQGVTAFGAPWYVVAPSGTAITR